jgi:hypothetical protein
MSVSDPPENGGSQGKQNTNRTQSHTLDGDNGDSEWVCYICAKISTGPECPMLQCAFCDKTFCISCKKVTITKYKQLGGGGDSMWFCSTTCGIATEEAIHKSKRQPLELDLEQKLSNEIAASRLEQQDFRNEILQKLSGLEVNLQIQQNHIEQVPTQLARTWSNLVSGTSDESTSASIPRNSFKAILKHALEEQKKEDTMQTECKLSIIIHRLAESKQLTTRRQTERRSSQNANGNSSFGN